MGQTPHHMTRTQGTLHDTVRCTEVHTRHMVQMLRVFPDYAADPVWGAEGMVDLDSLLIGHTAERVLERVECDLLVIKSHGKG